MGSNLKYEGIKEAIEKLGPEKKEVVEPAPEEVQKDWKRLASLMSGLK